MSEVSTTQALGGQFEATFRRHGIPFELVEEFPLADIERHEAVQCRLTGIAPKGRVSRYEEQARAGAQFPPLVVTKDTNFLIDGNTRLQAYINLGRATAPVYLVQVRNDTAAYILGGSLNQLGGADLQVEEQKMVALAMSANGTVATAIAKELGVSTRRVFSWQQVKQAEAHAREVGMLDTFQRLSQNSQEPLAKVARDQVFVELLSALGEKKPKRVELNDLVKRVNSASSDEEAVEDVRRTVLGWPELDGGSAQVPAMAARSRLKALTEQPATYWVDRVHTDQLLPLWRQLRELASDVVSQYEQ